MNVGQPPPQLWLTPVTSRGPSPVDAGLTRGTIQLLRNHSAAITCNLLCLL